MKELQGSPTLQRKSIVALSPFGKNQGEIKDFDLELRKIAKMKKKKAPSKKATSKTKKD